MDFIKSISIFITINLLLFISGCASEPSFDTSNSIYKAAGNKPDWSLDIYEQTDKTYNYELLLDNGKKKLSGTADLGSSKVSPKVTSYQLKYKTENIKINIIKNGCTDMTGVSHDSSLSFKYDNGKYTGCGDFVSLKE